MGRPLTHRQSPTCSLNPLRNGIVAGALVTCLMWAVIARLDPFGATSSADQQSEAIFHRLIAAPWYQSQAQHAITVVLIDDQYLRTVKSHWPLPYASQSMLLEQILQHRPLSVFLDFVYTHQHSEEWQVQQFVSAINNRGRLQTTPAAAENAPALVSDESLRPKIFIPHLVPVDKRATADKRCAGAHRGLASEKIAELAKSNTILPIRQAEAESVYLQWSGCGNRYPAYYLHASSLPSPAFALYKDYCQRSPFAGNGCPDDKRDVTADFSTPMMVRWGLGISPLHQSVLPADASCIGIESLDLIGRGFYFLSQVVAAVKQSFSSSRERGFAQPCVHTDTLNAVYLTGASDEANELHRKFIQDRIVLVGSQIDAVNDVAVSPVNNQVPGVFVHAMALDNYLTYGAAYAKDIENKWSLGA